MITDPISNLISSINNSISNNRYTLEVPSSSLKYRILVLLQKEGIIKSVNQIKNEEFAKLEIHLNGSYKKFIKISKPGKRIYVKYSKIPRNRREKMILSTPKGIMTAPQAIRENIGGEILMEVS